MSATCVPFTTRASVRGFTLVELLVVIAIVGLLVAMLLPAVQAARESARRSACENQLRQIGLALTAYVDVHQELPVGCLGCQSFPKKRISWLVALLPYLEEESLHEQFDNTIAIDASPNYEASRTVLPVLLCPSADGPTLPEQGGAFTDYAGLFGLEGVLDPTIPEEDISPRFYIPYDWFGVLMYEVAVAPREITDGLSKTLCVGEMFDRRIVEESEWARGSQLYAQDNATAVNEAPGRKNDLGSAHPGGALAVRCDAGVEFLTDDLDQAVLNAWFTRAGEEL